MPEDRPELDGFSWLMLDAIGGGEPIDIPWGMAYMHYRDELRRADRLRVEIGQAVRASLLDLFDRGYLQFFLSSWDEHLPLEPTGRPQLSRAEVERELDMTTAGLATDALLVAALTDEGEEAFRQRPHDAPEPQSGKVPQEFTALIDEQLDFVDKQRLDPADLATILLQTRDRGAEGILAAYRRNFVWAVESRYSIDIDDLD